MIDPDVATGRAGALRAVIAPTSPIGHAMHRSIPPSEPRKRAVVAAVCAMLLGAVIVMGFIRSCAGEDFWEDAKKLHEE